MKSIITISFEGEMSDERLYLLLGTFFELVPTEQIWWHSISAFTSRY